MALLIESDLRESSSIIASIDPAQIEAVADAMVSSLRKGGKVIFFGNGGSSADAMHLAAELAGRYLMERLALNGIALSSLSAITGIGNDYGYEKVFVRQLEACAKAGDVAVGLSTSGTSKNVALALSRARELGLVTVSFTGSSGTIKDMVDHPLIIPSTKTPRVQEGYLCAGHIFCGLVERIMFGRRAVFIDRDDTIVQDVPYCSRPEDLRLFPGVGKSIRRLNEAGYLAILVTNQSGIGRGYFDEAALESIHVRLKEELAADGARLDAIYYCPHRPDEGCGCRKPATGMLERAVWDLGIDLRSSYVIGDSENDVAMGNKAGCRCIQVTGKVDFNKAIEIVLE
jgi:D-sedoheptulose 7-phosphate isomerase